MEKNILSQLVKKLRKLPTHTRHISKTKGLCIPIQILVQTQLEQNKVCSVPKEKKAKEQVFQSISLKEEHNMQIIKKLLYDLQLQLF